MKWLPFLLLLFILLNCGKAGKKHSDTGKRQKEALLQKPGSEKINYNDTVKFPWHTETDTGFFKGYIPEKIEAMEYGDTSGLFKFLSGLITKKNILLLDSFTLSHSVLIDHVTGIRIDTLTNDHTSIVSIYNFNNKPSQTITINGVKVRDYKYTNTDDCCEDIYLINNYSFRHFSFNGKEYYYFSASPMDMFGTSAGNSQFRFIYDLENRKLNYLESCRFHYMLFGDSNGDNHLDCLDFDNSDFCTTVPFSDSVTIHLYSVDGKGNLTLQKDKTGIPYFISGRTGVDFRQDSFIVKKTYWPVPIK